MGTPLDKRARMLELREMIVGQPGSADRAAWGLELQSLYEELGGDYGREPESDPRDREIARKTAEINGLKGEVDARSDAIDRQAAEIVRLRRTVESLKAARNAERRRWWRRDETDRFAEFFRLLGHELEDFQRLIVAEIFSERREALILIPRGCGKSTLLLRWRSGRCCASRTHGSWWVPRRRDQAAILFDFCREMAAHPEIAPMVAVTRREIRTERGWVRVIAADGPRQHGHVLDLAICDELHAHARRDLYDALRTSMLKRPGARMVTISTAGATVDTPLGESV